MIPYANKLRPRTLDDFVGQEKFLYPDSLLSTSIKNKTFTSAIFFGLPGTGKTTLARIIAEEMDSEFKEINAGVTGIKDLKEILRVAELALSGLEKKTTFLYVDEFHRWNKLQQDALLQALEEGVVNFIGSTTENPYFSINNAILSRIGHIFEFKKLSQENIILLLQNALANKENGFEELKIDCGDDELLLIAKAADGDARLAIDMLGFIVTNQKGKKIKITKSLIEEAFQKKLTYYDKDEDRYDLLSALQKSVRGSDPDAALYYLARLLEGGADLMMVARRILVMAAEDVGMAYPNAIPVATSAVTAAQMTGLPEARIQLAFAVTFLASLPKTNKAFVAYEKAAAELSETAPPVPDFLKDSHYSGAKKLGRGLKYFDPHGNGGRPNRRYLPDELLKRGENFYQPTEIGLEKNFKKYIEDIRERIK